MPTPNTPTTKFDPQSLLKPMAEMPRRILVIDDDPLVVATIEHVLKAAGHAIRSTTHGKDVSRLIELFAPELVITDIIMSDIDTIETIETLRRAHPEIVIVAISGNKHLLTLAAKHGADHVLPKPFSPHALNILVNVALQ
jgi:two-component system, NtrC family, nitrogen regulation response regulator GlnG